MFVSFQLVELLESISEKMCNVVAAHGAVHSGEASVVVLVPVQLHRAVPVLGGIPQEY